MRFSLLFVAVRTHRLTYWLGQECSSSPPARSRVSYSRLLRSMSCQALSISQIGGSNTIWESVPAFGHPQCEQVLDHTSEEFPAFRFVPIASWPVTTHCREQPGLIFFTAPIRCLYTQLRSPWDFPSPGWTVRAPSAFPGGPDLQAPSSPVVRSVWLS